MSERCPDCDHRWTEHGRGGWESHGRDGCQHTYLNGDRCVCTEPSPAAPA